MYSLFNVILTHSLFLRGALLSTEYNLQRLPASVLSALAIPYSTLSHFNYLFLFNKICLIIFFTFTFHIPKLKKCSNKNGLVLSKYGLSSDKESKYPS